MKGTVRSSVAAKAQEVQAGKEVPVRKGTLQIKEVRNIKAVPQTRGGR